MAEDNIRESTPPKDSLRIAGHDPDVDQSIELLKKYAGITLAGFVAIVLLILGLGTYQNSQMAEAERAALALSSAQTVEDFERIVTAYGDTPSSQVAKLGLAATYFQEGRYAEAYNAYDAFLLANSGHPMENAARIAQAICSEAQGEFSQALEIFITFIASNPSNYLTPYSELGKARCLCQLEQWDEARAAYEDIIAAYPNSIWSRRADSDLQWVQRILRTHSR